MKQVPQRPPEPSSLQQSRVRPDKSSFLNELKSVYRMLFLAISPFAIMGFPALLVAATANQYWLLLLLITVPVGISIGFRFFKKLTE